jgi:hypothetical protein
MESTEIAKLIDSILEDRGNLLVARPINSLYAGDLGNFSVAQTNKLITARALNFCTGECLLAKVDNNWVAISSQTENRVITSRVDRLIWRRPKLVDEVKKLAFITSFTQVFNIVSEDILNDEAIASQPTVDWDLDNANASQFTILYPNTADPIEIEVEISANFLPIDPTYLNYLVTDGILYIGSGRDPNYPPALYFSGCYLNGLPQNTTVAGARIKFTVSLPTFALSDLDYSVFSIRFTNAFATVGLETLVQGQTLTMTLIKVGDLDLGNRIQSIFVPII